MTRSEHALSLPVSPHRRNFLAIIISFLTVSFLYLNFEPRPAGADPEASLTDIISATGASDLFPFSSLQLLISAKHLAKSGVTATVVLCTSQETRIENISKFRLL